MSKKDFIALANTIKNYNHFHAQDKNPIFGPAHIEALANFCETQNHRFNRDRWLAYIAGECGPNGGAR